MALQQLPMVLPSLILCATDYIIKVNQAFDFKLLVKWVYHLNRWTTCTFFAMSMRMFNVGGGWGVLQMSPSNEDASFAQWYGLGTLSPRTCQVVHVLDIYNFLSNGNRLSPELAKPRCFLCCMVTSHVYFWIFATRKGRVRFDPILLGIIDVAGYNSWTTDTQLLTVVFSPVRLNGVVFARETHSNLTIR